MAERNRAGAAAAEAEALRTERNRAGAERDTLRAEIKAWTAGRPWARVWRALWGRR